MVTLVFGKYCSLRVNMKRCARYNLAMALNTGLIKQIARRHGASQVRLFGSYLHGTQKDGSDIDVLVDLVPGRVLFDLVALKLDLEQEIGSDVDAWLLKARRHPISKEGVLREASPVYSETKSIASTSSNQGN